jgi:(2Fe-2S) ferredoxin
VSKFVRHFFVCQTQRPPGGKPACGSRGAVEVFNVLQEGLGGHPELWGAVQVSASGCLGPCFDGPSMVVYPEGVWYAPVTVEDAKEIAESHLVGGVVVERLRYRWPDDQ